MLDGSTCLKRELDYFSQFQSKKPQKAKLGTSAATYKLMELFDQNNSKSGDYVTYFFIFGTRDASR